MRSSTHRGIVSRSFEYQNNKLFSLCDALDLTKGTFLLFVASICVWLYAEAAEAQQKPDLSIAAAVGEGKSAVAQQASKRSVGCNCDPLQAPVALKAASAAKTYKPAKRVKLNKLNHRQLSRSTVKFAEAEIILSDQFSIEYISALPRAPGSDLEVLDNPERVRVQLPASEIEALVEQGAEVAILRNFVLVEGSANEADSSDGDVAAQGICSGPYREGSNGTNVFIPDNGPPAWVYSDIWISGAPSGATVMCIDVHYEIIHPWVGDLVVDLSDQDLSLEYNLWDDLYATGSDLSETVTGITAFNSELVNQAWLLWAIDTYPSYDYTYINSWWIKVYYEETGVYCSASGGGYEFISRVEVGDIDNSSGYDSYIDYTSLSTTMEIGTGYPIKVTNGNAYDEQDQCGIWVDWNQDMDFDDPGETIPVSGSPGLGPYYATITPVVDANLGDTRMRVRITWDEAPLPCGDADYGEVEDYTITVTGAPSFVTISGYVKTSNGIGIKDVLVSASTGETDTTDVDGYYERTLSSPWSGTITPSKTDWTFEPADRAYVNLITNISNADFTGAHTIYGGGKGTVADPYLIFTASQMNSIGTYYVDLYSHFKLMADIDLGSYTGDSFNIIGGPLSKFRGVFDGNGKRIYNFTYTSVSPNIHIKGIFKHLDGANAEIKDLGLVNPNLNGGVGTEVGVLVGRLSGSGSISGCYVEGGSVEGGKDVGGLVGLVENGTISNCYASCDVSGNDDYVGGLVGENEEHGTISNSYAKGTVSGDSYVGGFVGGNRGTLSDCYATGNVTGNYDVGGLIGLEFETVIGCYSTGSVTGVDNVGGLIGTMIGSGTVANCYSSGNVFGSESVGGLVGEDKFRPISNCYSVGKVTGSGSDIGGLIGYTRGTITDCFWDVNSSGQTTSGGGTGKTTAEMQMESTFTNWDFNDIWTICEAMNYPKLIWQTPLLGDFVCPDGVDMVDYSLFAGHWMGGNCEPANDYCEGADLDGDGDVDFDDLKELAKNWLEGKI